MKLFKKMESDEDIVHEMLSYHTSMNLLVFLEDSMLKNERMNSLKFKEKTIIIIDRLKNA